MVHFLLDGNDMEDIDDESDQDDGYKDVDEAADIRGVSSLGQQEPFQFFLKMSPPGQQKAGGIRGGHPACVQLQYMIFHNTYFSIWDLPCKSQCCAKLG